MHIPDSVLSPTTAAITGAAMLPIWWLAGRRVRKSLGTRQVPLLALGSAFCFTIMMFNIPALGGTTAHPVAGTLMAVLLGPWAAVIGISVALAIQALFFGDGGLLAYGANCFAMAFALPFVGYAIYNLLSSRLSASSPLRPVMAAIGAFVGLNAAAAVVAVVLGMQPVFFHEPNGQALYFPFGLKVTLPAMLLTHLLVAGPAEAIVTGLVVRYLQATGISLYNVTSESDPNPLLAKKGMGWMGRGVRAESLWIGLLALVALAPLGLLAKGEAWGEWDAKGIAEEIKKVEGREYVPQGVAHAEEHGYKGLAGLQDYASEKGAIAYIGAGVLGVGSIALLLFVGGRFLAGRKEEADKPSHSGTSLPPRTSEADVHSLPDWLRASSDSLAKPELSGRPPNPFLERTLSELAGGAAQTLQGEKWTRLPGLLQRLDARAKLIGFLSLILLTTFLRQPLILVALYLLTLALGVASRLPVAMLLRRVWLSVPLFVGAIVLPASLNIVTPGHPLLTLWKSPYLAVTAPGLLAAFVLTLRVGVAVSLANLLTLTTGWNDLLRALRAFFVPRLFVTSLAMTYRYITVLLQSAAEMFVARRSRTVGRTSNQQGRQFIGNSMGALFGKTLTLSEEVHAAMVSRGFQGEMRTLTVWQWRAGDTLWLCSTLMVAIIALGSDYLIRGGH